MEASGEKRRTGQRKETREMKRMKKNNYCRREKVASPLSDVLAPMASSVTLVVAWLMW